MVFSTYAQSAEGVKIRDCEVFNFGKFVVKA